MSGLRCIRNFHVHYGEEAPRVCPTCAHPQAYFEVRFENYAVDGTSSKMKGRYNG